jgi:fatty acid desaturase
MNPPSNRNDSRADAEPKPIHLRLLFGPLIPSLIVAAIIAPYAPFGTIEYVRGYAFLFVVACALAMIGTKMKVQRYSRASIVLLWVAPLLPIGIVVILGLLAAATGQSK